MNTLSSPQTQVSAPAQNETLPNTPTGGWEAFYNQLTAKANIPNLQCNNFSSDGVNAVFRGVCVKLSDIQAQLQTQQTSAGVNYDIITVYTDILNIDTEITWAIANTALVIYARVIDTAQGGGFTVNMDFTGTNTASSLMIFANSINGSIVVNANGSQLTSLSDSACQTGTGVNYNAGSKAAAVSTLQLYNGIPVGQISSDQSLYLSNAFSCAALCADTNPEIAVDMLVWVNGWAGASFTYNHQDFTQLFFQSSSLCTLTQSMATAQNNGAHYVPGLDGSVYESLIATFNTELSTNYSNYLTLFTAVQADANFISVAQTMQNVYGNEVANYTSLLAQAQQEYQSALDAENKANTNFQIQQTQVTTTGNNLSEIGIPAYIQKEALNAVVEIGKALIIFGVGIAGMLTGNEETAPAVAEGGVEAAEAVEGANSVASAMKNLKTLMTLLTKIYSLASSIYTTAEGINSPSNPVNPATTGVQGLNAFDSINSTAAWDVYQLQFDQSMTPLVNDDIEYAADYKTALETLVVYGKALTAAKIATINASQKVVSAQINLQYAQANTQSINNLVSSLQTNESNIVALQNLFYQKYLNTKLTLYTLLKNYEATYFYWALSPYPYPVNFIDFNGLSSNNNQLINMQLANYQALASFNGHLPQSMPSQQVTIDIGSTVINSSNTVITWSLAQNNNAFAQLARVRFQRVRIWLNGVSLYPATIPANGLMCSFGVSTSGNYSDTDMNGNTQLFSTGRYLFQFEYTVNQRNAVTNYDWVFAQNSNLVATVNLDGEIPINLQNDFIEPTPFTEWSLTFTSDSGLDVSQITSITMEFEGSAISLSVNAL